MIRRDIAPVLHRLARRYPVITLTGPRQSGKTTLARMEFPDLAYVSLEDPDSRRFAIDDPRGFLAQYGSGAIIDEVQRAPEIASYLQGLVDHDPRPGRFVLTGSHQFELMSSVSQSLAGRTAVLRLLPLTLGELRRLREAVQVDRDPLRGALFENMIVLEALKDRLNTGESAEMYFYRDSTGHEIDLMMPMGRALHAIEIKSGATVNPDYFKGLRTVSAHHPAAIESGCVIYGGDMGQSRTDWPVHSWRRLAHGRPRPTDTRAR
jgi:predicted AAA+ superfamily ATPase